MRKVLFLIPSLDYSGAAKQLLLLACGLPREAFERQVCVLGEPAPWSDVLTKHGVPVEHLGWRRPLDLRPPARLREVARSFRPDVIHLWRRSTLRWLAVTAGLGTCRTLVSAPLPVRERGVGLNLFDRWLLGRADALVVESSGAVERCRRLGLPGEQVRLVPPGVVLDELPESAPTAVREALGLPASARLLVAVGPAEPYKGFRDAAWALDVLRFLYDDVHLLLVGPGPELPRLERFLAGSQLTDRVHLLGPQPSVLPLLAAADVVWAPALADAGVQAALEAMALGKPVVAARQPGLAEVVVEGETGYLVPPGDKAALARQTRFLLDDAALRQRLGTAGRQRAEAHFAAETLVDRLAHLYSE